MKSPSAVAERMSNPHDMNQERELEAHYEEEALRKHLKSFPSLPIHSHASEKRGTGCFERRVIRGALSIPHQVSSL